MNKPIVDFYSGKATDTSGRTLREIHAWDYHKLENEHDYIQCLFPLPEASQYNPLAPVLDAGQIAIFHTDAELHTQLLASFDKMLEFYGFERNNMAIIRSITWEGGVDLFVRYKTTPYNHVTLLSR